MSPDVYVWQQLWHAMKGVTIVGHPPGGPCPYQVGHSFHEHIWMVEEWAPVEAKLKMVIDAGLHTEVPKP